MAVPTEKKDKATEVKSQELVVTEGKGDALSGLSSTDELLKFGELILRTGNYPQRKPEEAVAVILTGRELGLGPMASLNNIHSINNRSSVGIHVIIAKLRQAGIVIEVLANFKKAYKYKAPDGNLYYELESVIPEGSVRAVNPTDVYSRVKFIRDVKMASGKYYTQTHIETFTWTQAEALGLTDRDQWKRQGPNMLLNRTVSKGGRFIADDILLGLYTDDEAMDIPQSTHQASKVRTEEAHAEVSNVSNKMEDATDAEIVHD